MAWVKEKTISKENSTTEIWVLYLKFNGARWNNSTSRKACKLVYTHMYKKGWNEQMKWDINPYKRFVADFDGLFKHVPKLEFFSGHYKESDEKTYSYIDSDYAKNKSVSHIKDVIQSIYLQLD